MTNNNDQVDPEEVTLAATERLRRELGEDLVEVVFFGSRARGDAKDGSDFDLLVVLRDGSAIPKASVFRVAADIDLAFQVVVSAIVKTESQWRREKALPLAKEIRRHGKILYAKAA